MAKKKEEINQPIASTLNMPKQKVVDLLRKQIEQSDVLLQYQVPSHQVMRGYDMFGGGVMQQKSMIKKHRMPSSTNFTSGMLVMRKSLLVLLLMPTIPI